MKSFYVRRADGKQDGPSLAILSAPGQQGKIAKLGDGEYTVRDALGGLRLRVHVVKGQLDYVERTK